MTTISISSLIPTHISAAKAGPTTIERWMLFTRVLWQSSPIRTFALALYYLLILLGLLLLYSSGGGSVTAPPFVYQGF